MHDLKPGDPTAIGRYRLLGRLGSGGMGVVYQGRSPGGRVVAVKVVHAHLLDRDPSFRSRFRREIEAAKRVGGFYTAAVIDGDADAPSPWYASAFIDAPTLTDVVRKDGPLVEARTRELGAGLAEALAAVHEAGLVHRDLKPTNVLVAGDGPRVIDFGIARVADVTGEPLTATPSGMIVGTPGYLAPEQLRGAGASAASDVFALGALLAFAATGRAPFPGATAAEIMLRTMTGEPELSGIPLGLLPVVQRCLDRSPERRPSVAELVKMSDANGPDTGTDPYPTARQTARVPPRPRRTRLYTPDEPVRPAKVRPVDADEDTEERDIHRVDHLPVNPVRLLLAAVLVGASPGLLVLWANASTFWAVGTGALAAFIALFLLAANNARAETPAQRLDVGTIEAGLALVAAPVCALAVSLHTFALDWWWHVGIAACGWLVAAAQAIAVLIMTDRFDLDFSFVISAAGIGVLSTAVATLLLLFMLGALPWIAVVGGVAAGTAIGVVVGGLARPTPLTT